MSAKDFFNLTDKILIATPFTMEGNVFNKSLIYVIKHTKQGSMGLIFNRPINDSLEKNLFNKNFFNNINRSVNIDTNNLKFDIYLGGPTEIERGFFLHTADYTKNLLFKSKDSNLAISSNTEILRDVSNGSGPEKSLFIMGYTSWEPKQMEFEIENNLWIIAEPNNDLIFSGEASEKWDKAINSLGLSTNDFAAPYVAFC